MNFLCIYKEYFLPQRGVHPCTFVPVLLSPTSACGGETKVSQCLNVCVWVMREIICVIERKR